MGTGTGTSPARWRGAGDPAAAAGPGSAGPPWHPRSPPRAALAALGGTRLGRDHRHSPALAPTLAPTPAPCLLTVFLAVPSRPPQAVLQPLQGPGQAWGQGRVRQDTAPEPSPTGRLRGPQLTFLMQMMCQALPSPFLGHPVTLHGAFLCFILLLLLTVPVLCRAVLGRHCRGTCRTLKGPVVLGCPYWGSTQWALLPAPPYRPGAVALPPAFFVQLLALRHQPQPQQLLHHASP